jgi:hypothetical protein
MCHDPVLCPPSVARCTIVARSPIYVRQQQHISTIDFAGKSVSLRPLWQEHAPAPNTHFARWRSEESVRRYIHFLAPLRPFRPCFASKLHISVRLLARFFRFRGLRSGSSRGRADQALPEHSRRATPVASLPLASLLILTQCAPPPHLPRPPAASFRPPPANARQPS